MMLSLQFRFGRFEGVVSENPVSREQGGLMLTSRLIDTEVTDDAVFRERGLD